MFLLNLYPSRTSNFFRIQCCHQYFHFKCLVYGRKCCAVYSVFNYFFYQVFEAEKMNSKKGFYHKKCFSCIKCKTQTDYFNAIEGPDDEVNSCQGAKGKTCIL